MPDKIIEFPIKRGTIEEIFKGFMEIGEVVEDEQSPKEMDSIKCPHCGNIFQFKDNP